MNMNTGDPRADAWLAGYADALDNPPDLRATFKPFLRTSPLPAMTVPGSRDGARLALLANLEQYVSPPYDVTISADLRHGSVWVGGHVADQGWMITLDAIIGAVAEAFEDEPASG